MNKITIELILTKAKDESIYIDIPDGVSSEVVPKNTNNELWTFLNNRMQRQAHSNIIDSIA